MSSGGDTFARAWQYHQANDFVQAERLYRQVVEADPRHADAWCFLGAVHQAQGNPAEAELCYRRAVDLVPSYASAHNFLGILLAQQGRLDEAVACFARLLRFQPDDADACNNLGLVRAQQGRLDEAVAHYQQALRLRPEFPAARENLERVLRQRGGPAPAPVPVGPSPAPRETAHALNQRGIALARQGRFAEAVAAFQEAMQAYPNSPDAPNNLGTLLVSQGRVQEGIGWFQRALAIKPDFTGAHYNLGVALEQQGQREEAAASYRQALRHDPGHLDAENNLGNVLRAQGDVEGALACYRAVLRRRPDFAEVLVNVGNSLAEQGKWEDAEVNLRQAVHLRPGYAEAHNALGHVLNRSGRRAEAVACYREAVRLRPDFAEAHHRLAHALRDQGQFEEAIHCCREAVRLRPDYPEAYNNWGTSLYELDRFAEAASCFQEAVRLRSDYAEALSNWGHALWRLKRLEEALSCYTRYLELRPEDAETHFNRANVQLTLGDFARGWPEYEWRLRTGGFSRREFHRPCWDGSDLAGRTILIYAEQGFGDTLQFVRYTRLLQQRGGRVVFECPPELQALLGKGAGIDQLVPAGTPLPAFDVHAPLLSLPGLFDTTLRTIPAEVPYLAPPEQLTRRWRHRLGGRSGFTVGISWQGRPTHRNDRHRSVPLTCLEPLIRLSGVRLVSLQKGHGADQVDALGGRFPVQVLGPDLETFADTAAVMQHLDLVVTVDTAVAHLAGALGVPVWVAVPYAPDWRWLLEREDSPWYPSMRLFRQQQSGDWFDVFARIARALHERLSSPEKESS